MADDLDRDETRALARTLAHQLNPSLEGDRLTEAAANLMRLAARMAGHVAHDVAAAHWTNDPESDGSERLVTVPTGALASQAHATGEELAEEQPCPGCGAVGGHYGGCNVWIKSQLRWIGR